MPYVSHHLLVVSDVGKSCSFYLGVLGMRTTMTRVRANGQIVAWIGSTGYSHRLILVEGPRKEHPVGPYGHVGVSCVTKDEYLALLEGCRNRALIHEGPRSQDWPICDWFSLLDPDGNRIEVSWGQDQFDQPVTEELVRKEGHEWR